MNSQVVDCAMHPPGAALDVFRKYIPEPWTRLRLGDVENHAYPTPVGKEPSPGDPDAARTWMESNGVDLAVLLPLSRGLQPDHEWGTAIASATNEWLSAEWLDGTEDKFRGSIRVFPHHIPGAVAEIDRWGADSRFVQVAVPLGVHAPYGNPQYWDIWEAADHYGLPIVVHVDGGSGIELPPSMVGYPTTFFEYYTLHAWSGLIHMISLLAEGVLTRFSELKFVFADGGFDAHRSFLWRMDKEWLSTRYRTPWVEVRPSEQVRHNIRFILQRSDGPPLREDFERLLTMEQSETMLLYGSNFPNWDLMAPADVPPVAAPLLEGILSGNARALYQRRTEASGTAPANR